MELKLGAISSLTVLTPKQSRLPLQRLWTFWKFSNTPLLSLSSADIRLENLTDVCQKPVHYSPPLGACYGMQLEPCRTSGQRGTEDSSSTHSDPQNNGLPLKEVIRDMSLFLSHESFKKSFYLPVVIMQKWETNLQRQSI